MSNEKDDVDDDLTDEMWTASMELEIDDRIRVCEHLISKNLHKSWAATRPLASVQPRLKELGIRGDLQAKITSGEFKGVMRTFSSITRKWE